MKELSLNEEMIVSGGRLKDLECTGETHVTVNASESGNEEATCDAS